MVIIDDKGCFDWFSQFCIVLWCDVLFQVDLIEWLVGENMVLWEYLFQDLLIVFLMGVGVDEIKFFVYVIGDDYFDQFDKLWVVLKGDGVLIYFMVGSMCCWLYGKYMVCEVLISMGGVVCFDLMFVCVEVC